MKCFTPERLKSGHTVPCGKCAMCIKRKRQDWSARVFFECMEATNLFFVTLTYSDEYLTYIDSDVPVLNYDDVQKFFKRVRKKGFQFKYFMVGEYGEHSKRPHYHMLLLFDNAVDINILLNEWKYGFTHVGKVTMASIMYMLKDMLKEVDLFEDTERQFKPQIRASKGIGLNYAKKCFKWHAINSHERNFIVVNGVKMGIPRYLRTKITELIRLDNEAKEKNKESNARISEINHSKARRRSCNILHSISDSESKKEKRKAKISHQGFENERKKQLKINHFNKKL